MAGDNTKVSRLRRGVKPHKLVTLGNGSDTIDVMVVLLPSDLIMSIEEQVEEYCQKNEGKVNPKIRNKLHNKLLCHYCMRDPEDPTYNTFMTESPDDVGRNMDDEDIKRICEAYNQLLINKAPKLEMLNEDEFKSLKKYLEVTPLSGLSTVSLVHLTNFHQTIVSEK
jgi:hypothetical protein